MCTFVVLLTSVQEHETSSGHQWENFCRKTNAMRSSLSGGTTVSTEKKETRFVGFPDLSATISGTFSPENF